MKKMKMRKVRIQMRRRRMNPNPNQVDGQLISRCWTSIWLDAQRTQKVSFWIREKGSEAIQRMNLIDCRHPPTQEARCSEQDFQLSIGLSLSSVSLGIPSHPATLPPYFSKPGSKQSFRSQPPNTPIKQWCDDQLLYFITSDGLLIWFPSLPLDWVALCPVVPSYIHLPISVNKSYFLTVPTRKAPTVSYYYYYVSLIDLDGYDLLFGKEDGMSGALNG